MFGPTLLPCQFFDRDDVQGQVRVIFILSRWTNWPPQARTICHVLLFLEFVMCIYFDSNQFWHPATASGFLTRFWNKTSHGRTLSKKKKILNPPAIKINQNIAMEHRHGSWKNHLWTDLNGTRSFTRLERGSECQWMRSKMTWSILKQSINEPAVGLYTKWSLPALFLAWHPRHTNFHSSSLTVVLTVRFSSFFPNSHTVAPPVESCFMFIIVSLSNWCTSRQGKKPSK